MTIEQNQLPKTTYNKISSAYRARGRRRKRWIDIKNIQNKHGYNVDKITQFEVGVKDRSNILLRGNQHIPS